MSPPGATGRAVNAISQHLPEFALYVYHQGDDTLQAPQITTWDGTSWSYPSLESVGGAYGYNGANDWLEYRLPKADFP